MVDLNSQLALDHRARVVWAFVEGLDLSALYARIRGAGRTARADRRPIRRSCWGCGCLATLEGVGSARQLDRLCERDVAYRWLLRRGCRLNYHGLSDFRCEHAEVLDRFADGEPDGTGRRRDRQAGRRSRLDGTKVRASAGRGSFRKAAKLADLEGWAAATG